MFLRWSYNLYRLLISHCQVCGPLHRKEENGAAVFVGEKFSGKMVCCGISGDQKVRKSGWISSCYLTPAERKF